MAEPTDMGPGRDASNGPPPPVEGVYDQQAAADAYAAWGPEASVPGPDGADVYEEARTAEDAYATWGPGEPAAAAPPPPTSPPPRPSSPPPPKPHPESVARDAVQEVIDASADFLITGRDFIRQEAEGVMREKVAPPLAEVGVTVASMWGAVTFLILGLIFIGVAAIIALSQLVGPALAFLIVGAVYMIGAGIFLYIKVKQVQRSAEAMKASQELRGTGPAATSAPTAKQPRS